MTAHSTPTTIATTILFGALLSGCPSDDGQADDEGDEPVTVDLAEMPAWVRVTDPNQDAFADQRPADAVCDDLGYYVDPFSQTLEILTEVCDYLTVQQPTLVALEPGDVVTVLGFHDVLTADQPTQGYLALAFAGAIEWEYLVPIPGDPAIFEQSFTVDRAIPAGTDLQFHLHNHGPNTWELAAVVVTPGE